MRRRNGCAGGGYSPSPQLRAGVSDSRGNSAKTRTRGTGRRPGNQRRVGSFAEPNDQIPTTVEQISDRVGKMQFDSHI
ncbi:hypothetical protein BC2230_90148 [Burkholderia cepacia]